MLRLSHRPRAHITGGVCFLVVGCALPASPGAESEVESAPAPVTLVEVISVERWIVDGLQESDAPWDTVRLTASLADLTPEEAAESLPPQFWLGIPAFPDPLLVGTMWTDSIRIWQGDALNRRSLLLSRHSRVLADTLLAGRRTLIVEEWAGVGPPMVLHFELRSWETQVPGRFYRHERAAYQELRARSWIDPDGGIYRARWDTLRTTPGPRSFDRWIGPGGDTVEVPARFDAIREFRVLEQQPEAGG